MIVESWPGRDKDHGRADSSSTNFSALIGCSRCMTVGRMLQDAGARASVSALTSISWQLGNVVAEAGRLRAAYCTVARLCTLFQQRRHLDLVAAHFGSCPIPTRWHKEAKTETYSNLEQITAGFQYIATKAST